MAGAKANTELWDRLDNETPRAYEAFKVYMQCHPAVRTVAEAWRHFSDNPDAKTAPDHVRRWAWQFAWAERAQARDAHLDAARRRGEERAIEREAEKQAVESERTRNRFMELMAVGYEAAMKTLEEVASGDTSMRPSEAIQIVKLHFEATRDLAGPDQGDRDEWTEEDDREFAEGLVEDIYPEAEGDSAEEDESPDEEESP